MSYGRIINFSNLFPKYRAFVISFHNGLYGSSSVVFLAFKVYIQIITLIINIMPVVASRWAVPQPHIYGKFNSYYFWKMSYRRCLSWNATFSVLQLCVFVLFVENNTTHATKHDPVHCESLVHFQGTIFCRLYHSDQTDTNPFRNHTNRQPARPAMMK